MTSYFDLDFDIVHAATNNRYVDDNYIRLVNLSPIGLLKNYKLTTSSGKHLGDISHAHIVSLMYQLRTCAKESDHLSLGLERDRNRKQRKLTINKNQKGNYKSRIMFTDVFGFVEYHEKIT